MTSLNTSFLTNGFAGRNCRTGVAYAVATGSAKPRARGIWPVLLSALMLILSPPGATAGPDVGLISITFDDASRAQFDHGLRLAKAYGLVGTLFVPTSLIADVPEPGSWTISWDEVRAFQAAGWEIGSHGQHHLALPGMTDPEIQAEIEGSAAEIVAQTGTWPVSFSSPFGAFTAQTVDRVMAVYKAHLSWQGHGGRNPRASIDPRFIGRFEVVNSLSAAEVCGEMVKSARAGTWLVLLFHGITDHPPGEYEVSTDMVDDIFACAAFLQANGLVEVRTVRDALTQIEAVP